MPTPPTSKPKGESQEKSIRSYRGRVEIFFTSSHITDVETELRKHKGFDNVTELALSARVKPRSHYIFDN